MTDYNYIRFWISLFFGGIAVYMSYDFGYMAARETYQVSTKFRCHQEIVYRWTGAYWEKLSQPCKTDEQMQEKNNV